MIRFNVPPYTGHELENVKKAIENMHICGDGEFTRKCSEYLEKITGTSKCLLTTSCTHALEMAALLCDLKEGDEVKYGSGSTVVWANKNISFDIKQGELVIILGSSGAGKSTLLNILGGMENVSEGEVIVNGKDIAEYSAKELTKYRRNEIGFVFQFYNLIPNLTAKENVELANELVTNPIDAEVALKEVGLEKRINNFPSQLSGGEQQRVAIARAIAKNPSLLLCDEPTGALDYQTGKKVLKILQDRSLKKNSTVVIVTHNAALAPIADKVIRIQDGKVKQIENNSSPQDIAQIEW